MHTQKVSAGRIRGEKIFLQQIYCKKQLRFCVSLIQYILYSIQSITSQCDSQLVCIIYLLMQIEWPRK